MARPAILLPNDPEHSPHHVAHGGLRGLRSRHPSALSADQFHQLSYSPKQGEQSKRTVGLGDFPPGDREWKVARDAKELGLPYLRCSSSGP